MGETEQELAVSQSNEVSRAPTRREQGSAFIHAARHARYEEVVALKARGWSQTRIAETLHLDRKIVRAWLRSGQTLAWRQPAKGRRLDPFLDHLQQRWDDGCHNAALLWGEIKSLGFTGQRTLVRDWTQPQPQRQSIRNAASMVSASWSVPSRRRAAWLVIANEREIDQTEQAFVSALIARSPELAQTITVARSFRAMVRGQ